MIAPPVVVALRHPQPTLRSYFDVRALPGSQAKVGGLVLRNRTGRRVRVALDPLDAVTAVGLGSAYQVRGLPTHGATHWTRLAARRVTLGPHERKLVRVHVAVPPGARAGDYLSGIGIQQIGRGSASVQTTAQVSVSSTPRYAIGLEVRVPGPRHAAVTLPAASIVRRPGGLTALVDVDNTGNAIVQGLKGYVTVTGADRRTVGRARVGPGTLVTGTRTQIPVAIPRVTPEAGDQFVVRARLHFRGGTAHLTKTVTFGHRQAVTQEHYGGPSASDGGPSASDGGSGPSPGWLIASGLALADLLAMGVWLARRRRRAAA